MADTKCVDCKRQRKTGCSYDRCNRHCLAYTTSHADVAACPVHEKARNAAAIRKAKRGAEPEEPQFLELLKLTPDQRWERLKEIKEERAKLVDLLLTDASQTAIDEAVERIDDITEQEDYLEDLLAKGVPKGRTNDNDEEEDEDDDDDASSSSSSSSSQSTVDESDIEDNKAEDDVSPELTAADMSNIEPSKTFANKVMAMPGYNDPGFDAATAEIDATTKFTTLPGLKGIPATAPPSVDADLTLLPPVVNTITPRRRVQPATVVVSPDLPLPPPPPPPPPPPVVIVAPPVVVPKPNKKKPVDVPYSGFRGGCAAYPAIWGKQNGSGSDSD